MGKKDGMTSLPCMCLVSGYDWSNRRRGPSDGFQDNCLTTLLLCRKQWIAMDLSDVVTLLDFCWLVTCHKSGGEIHSVACHRNSGKSHWSKDWGLDEDWGSGKQKQMRVKKKHLFLMSFNLFLKSCKLSCNLGGLWCNDEWCWVYKRIEKKHNFTRPFRHFISVQSWNHPTLSNPRWHPFFHGCVSGPPTVAFRAFNLMFETYVGPYSDGASKSFLDERLLCTRNAGNQYFAIWGIYSYSPPNRNKTHHFLSTSLGEVIIVCRCVWR